MGLFKAEQVDDDNDEAKVLAHQIVGTRLGTVSSKLG